MSDRQQNDEALSPSIPTNVNYQTELQQQRLRNLAAELAALNNPEQKLRLIEQRLLDNLQQLQRQLAILQPLLPTAAVTLTKSPDR